jgi:hypothetical protein
MSAKRRTKRNLCIFSCQLDLLQKIGKGLVKQGYALTGLFAVEIYSFCVLEKLKLDHQAVTQTDINKLFENLFSDGRKNLLVGDYLINRKALLTYGLYRFIPRTVADLEIDWDADEARTVSFEKI